MIHRVKIFGLQRSGTKYIEELIRQNIDVTVDDHGSSELGWKHAMPHEAWPKLGIPKPTIQLIQAQTGLLVLVVRKTRDQWFASIKRRHMDISHRSGLEKWNNKVLAPLWARFYEAWQEAGFEIIEYEEILRDYVGFLKSLEERGLKRRGEFHNIDVVPLESGKWSEARRKSYLK